MRLYSNATLKKNSLHIWLSITVVLLVIAGVAFWVISPRIQDAKAISSGSDFNPGRIIDDAVFYNSGALSASDIQSFLNSKVPTCDTNGTGASGYGGTRAQYAASRGWHGPPYTCLRDYKQNTPQMEAASGLCGGLSAMTNASSAQIISSVANACGINPQVLLVLLEKEQSLVTDVWPLNSQFTKATGFACPDTAPCDPSYGGFFYQVYNAARQFKVYQAYPNNYNYVAGRTNRVYWQTNLGNFVNSSGNENDPSRSGQSGCGYSNIYIENQATAALYIYTPYQPNQKALANLYGTGDGCSAYGNRNFWRLFSDWFGSTQAFVYNGVNYSSTFDPGFYADNNPDIKAALGTSPTLLFQHFISNGMKEGRQASANFNVFAYRNRFVDLRWAYGMNIEKYYLHYALVGKYEGRDAIGSIALTPTTIYNGVDYSAVYNLNSYRLMNRDVARAYEENDDTTTLKQFVVFGMKEGRQASTDFNVYAYKNRYADLRNVFGNDLTKYYLHYIQLGKNEKRIAI